MDKAMYAGEDISASIIRDKNTKAASLEIKSDGEWVLYAGKTVESISFSKPLLKGKDSGIFPLDVPENERSYFQLVTGKGKAILAERHLPMTGGYNFRDLGGYKTKDGRFVKWGKIFRSDDLFHLTDDDLRYLSSIPVVSVVDFRSEAEIAQAPDKLPASSKGYAYSINPGNLSTSAVAPDLSSLDAASMQEIMKNINVSLVTDPVSIDHYKNFFALLQSEKDIPLLFHCSAGKDRTGMGAALVFFALGVDETTIFEDYLASNTYLGDKYAKFKEENPEMGALYEVRREYLQAGIDRIRQDHGTVETYLEKILNVDLEKFRKMYLY
ncbi:MAG: tyrosine-protein phosphatase [Bacteroidales bacterium]|jgi:protein-tyrosine phosphatase|nr:tyrosine-protein phosphatase [Bacteroidales bacterium]